MRAAVRPRGAVDELRERIESIDRSIVLALCAREAAQRELLALKRAHRLTLIDPEQERTVRRRAREWAEALDGDPDLAAHVIGAALEAGKRRFFATGGTPDPAFAPVVVYLDVGARSLRATARHHRAAVVPAP